MDAAEIRKHEKSLRETRRTEYLGVEVSTFKVSKKVRFSVPRIGDGAPLWFHDLACALAYVEQTAAVAK